MFHADRYIHHSVSIKLWLSVHIVMVLLFIMAIPAYAAPEKPKLSDVIEVSNSDARNGLAPISPDTQAVAV